MFDAYKVAVKLTLMNGVSSGLTVLASQFRSFDKDVTKTHSSLSRVKREMLEIKRLTLVGGAMTAAGGFGLSLFKGPIEAATEYEQAYSRFKTLNLGAEANRQADQFARASHVFGTSSTDMMDALHASVGLMGGLKNAMQVAPMLAELNAANGVLFGGKIQKLDSGSVGAIMRFNDMRGLTDSPADFKRGLDVAEKLVSGSGGMIKFTDLYQMAKRGGTAFKSLSDDGILMLASVMQEQGGSATGTALMSMYQNLVAGRTTKKAMAKLSDAGLAKLGYVSHGMVGGKEYKTLQVTGVVGEDLLRTNPGAWLMQYVVPAAKAHGAKSTSDIVAFVNDLLSNRTGSNLGAVFTTQQFQALRDQKIAKNAMGVEQVKKEADNTPAGKFADMVKNWNSLLTELGLMIMPTVIKGTKGLIGIVQHTKDFVHEFPAFSKGLVISFGVLSGIVAVGGVVMMATAAFKALGLAMAFNAVGGVGGLLGMARALPMVAGGLAVVSASVLAAAAGLAAAGLAGWKTGGWLNGKINQGMEWLTGGKEHSFGEWVYDKTHSDANKPMYVPGAKKGGQTVHTTINMDGKKVAEAVTKHQDKAASRPNTAQAVFDGNMGLRPVGF